MGEQGTTKKNEKNYKKIKNKRKQQIKTTNKNNK